MSKATGPAYKVAFRRRRLGLTNYSRRLGLVKSTLPRMVVRKARRGVLVQFIAFSPTGDSVLACAKSQQLSKFGWGARRNTPSAYLTGLFAGKLAATKKISGFVLDVGIATPSKGAIVFAALQGALDAGLKANYDGKMIDASRISGAHIAKYAASSSGTQFAAYARENFDPKKIEEAFAASKQKILEAKW